MEKKTLVAPVEASRISLTFIQPEGKREEVVDVAGKSVMDFAMDHGIKGIEAQCGGACICTTCLCFFSQNTFDRMSPPDFDEIEMLSYVPNALPTSRLACQIEVTPDLDGIEVHVQSTSE